MFQTEVLVETLDVETWKKKYCDPERFVPLCRACPAYHTRWSCPPGLPPLDEIIGENKEVKIIGLKVIYDQEEKTRAMRSPEETQKVREETYTRVKRQLLEILLSIEKLMPGSVVIMAGGCLICPVCARVEGKPCRHPDKMRYSYSGLGFDLGRIAEEVLKVPLLWSRKGLPDYDVAIASFLHNG